jgi:hypothetical protein
MLRLRVFALVLILPLALLLALCAYAQKTQNPEKKIAARCPARLSKWRIALL